MECSHNCATCNSNCRFRCPICGESCIHVNSLTVQNLVNRQININNKYFLCTNSNCDIIYVDEHNIDIFSKEDVKVPVWFKSDFFNYIVCYCRNIYLRDIFQAVFSIEEPTKENILKYLNKENVITDCLLNNPTGKSCDLLFKNSIDYAVELKKQQE